MKKLYYPLIAISMTIISFILTPIKSYAAGTNQSLTFIFDNDNLRLGVTYNGSAMSSFYDDAVGSPISFDFTVNLRFVIPTSGLSGTRPLYASGYAQAFVQIPLTFGAGADSSTWSYSYDVSYSDSTDTVIHNVPQVRAQNTNLQIYYYAYFDNYYLPTNAGSPCEVAINFHVNSYRTSAAVTPGLTLGTATFTNNGYQMIYNTNPITTMGMARIISLAVEHAIHNSVDIDLIYAMISDLYNVDSTYLPLILGQLQNDYTMLGYINTRLLQMYGQDYDFYDLVLQYLQQYGMTEASEAASEATSVEMEMSEVAESLEIQEPSIDGVFDDLDNMVNMDNQNQLFFWLQGNGNILVSILIFTFAIALAGYVLYGRM